jgi:Phosphate-selective porin O and P
MRRHPIGRLVVAALLAAALLPAAAQAQVIIKASDTVFMRLGAQIQTWADWQQDATTRGYAENLYIRRARVLLTGQVAPDVTFFIQTDNPNVGKVPKSLGTGFLLQDAWAEWKIADAFAIDAGEFLVPLSRNALQSTISFFTLDISPTSTVFSAPTQSNGLRDTGFEAKGYLIDGGRLEYRAALFQGIRVAGARNAFRDSAYLQYDFLEKERGYVYAGTNLGKKAIFAISSGYDAQKDYKAYSGNVSWTLPFGGGNEIGGQVQDVHYNGATFIPTIPKQNDILAELAIYLASANVQPFGKFESQKFTNTIDKAKDQTRYGAGLHYYVHGQNLKLTGQYLHVSPKSPLKDTNEFTVAMQVWYY